MSKIIERIVKSGGSPGENDLWLKKDANGDISLNAFDNGEWKDVACGGGGGSVDGAISYNEQTLTDEQKMQARINQGLYAEGPVSLSIEWDGDTTGKEAFRGEYYRVADYIYIEDGESLVATVDGQEFTQELVAVDMSEEAGVAKGTIIELSLKDNPDFVGAYSFNNFSYNGVTLDGVYFDEFLRKIEIPGEVYNKIPSKFIELDSSQIYKVIIAYNEEAYKFHEMKDSSGNIIESRDVINAMKSGKTVIAEYNSGNKRYLTQNVFQQRNNRITFLFVIDYDYNRDAVYLAGYPGSRDGEAPVYDKNASPSNTSYYASVTNMKDNVITFLIAQFAGNDAAHVESFKLPAFDMVDLTQEGQND